VTATLEFIDLQAQRRRLGDGVEKAIARVLEHGKFIMGPEVFELEERLAEYSRVAHAVSCASGTDALVLGLMAQGVGPGDAVLVPSFTFAATAEAVAILGAVPVFVDVLADSFNLDPVSLAAGISTARGVGLRPVGVIPVDLFGAPADYEAINKVVTEDGLWIIADAAQSYGATCDGVPVGSLAPTTTTSFFPAKPLGCYGDGGAIFTDDDDLCIVLRSLRVHGQGTDKYDNVRVGINGRLDTIQAAVLLEKLKIFDSELSARDRVAETYRELLGELTVQAVHPCATSAWAQYTVVLPTDVRRDDVMRRASSAGVPTATYYSRPLHWQPAYRGFPTATDTLPVTDDLADRVLSLPMHPYLAPADQQRVAEVITTAIR
jgi:dTDP-4-amino-4,6-dideoxygalactose transaminase